MSSKKSYEELHEEIYGIYENQAKQLIPRLCRALRNELCREDDTEEFIELNKKSIKIRIMHDLRGTFFKDRIYDKYGRRLLPRKGEKRRNYRYPDESEFIISRPKEPSRMAKFVEQLIDEEIDSWKAQK